MRISYSTVILLARSGDVDATHILDAMDNKVAPGTPVEVLFTTINQELCYILAECPKPRARHLTLMGLVGAEDIRALSEHIDREWAGR